LREPARDLDRPKLIERAAIMSNGRRHGGGDDSSFCAVRAKIDVSFTSADVHIR
jgi:hypothetical protein